MVRVVVLQERLGGRRDRHGPGRDEGQRAHGRGRAPQRRRDCPGEERQERDQEARARHPAAQRERVGMTPGVPDELDDDKRRDQHGLGP